MNSLSWMIYLAEICDRAQDAAGFIAFMFGFMGLFGVGAAWANLIVEGGRLRLPVIVTLLYLVIEIPMAAIGVLTPSSSTIYMIAASEAGETVVTSPEAKEMLGDLQEIIRRKLKEELSEVGI